MIELRCANEQDIPRLKELWADAFGDSGSFVELFFSTAFSPDRSMVLTQDAGIAAALYWIDCNVNGIPLAYLYAVATFTGQQGRGFASRLMEHTHRYLAAQGYGGVILSPGDDGLYEFYSRFGYRVCSHHREFYAQPGLPAAMAQISAAEYSALRRCYLPENSVCYGSAGLAFLQGQARLYRGPDFVCAVSTYDSGTILELLGDPQAAPGIAAGLGGGNWLIRTPGQEEPCAMALALNANALPEEMYLGFSFD